MRYIMKPRIVDVEKYQRGIEDGNGCKDEYNFGSGGCYDNSDASYCKMCSLNGPYLNTTAGKQFLAPADYVATREDGSRYRLSHINLKRDFDLLPSTQPI